MRKLVKKFKYVPVMLQQWLKYALAGRGVLPRPNYLALKVTNQCDASCVMCAIWHKKEISVPDQQFLKSVFSSPLLKEIKTLNLVGGEPTLRADLADLVRLAVGSMPGLKMISLITNGLNTKNVISSVEQITSLIEPEGRAQFSITVSLDGYGQVHDSIRGVQTAFGRVDATLKALLDLRKNSDFNINIVCTVQKLNAGSLNDLKRYADSLALSISFQPVACLNSDRAGFDGELSPPADQLPLLKQFILEVANLDISRRSFWRDYFRMRKGQARRFPCFLSYSRLGLLPNGEVYLCGDGQGSVIGDVKQDSLEKIWSSPRAKEVRVRLKQQECARCFQAHDPGTALLADPLYLLKEGLGIFGRKK